MSPEVSRTQFTCELITIRTKKSFEDVTSALEGLFATVDLPRLADMTAAADQAGIQSYFEEISGEHEFSVFFQLDQGSTQRLAGYPINCRFYLIGNAVIANGLFEYGAVADDRGGKHCCPGSFACRSMGYQASPAAPDARAAARRATGDVRTP